ncbi:MAG: Uncharacterised protein [Hyphomonas sp. TMED17]|nr:MAG: Uncharacterised protein [Hyphomonas sp. TMED17]
MTSRAGLPDNPGRFDEVDGIIVMLWNSGCNSEYVGVKNDVFGREIDFFD